MSKEVVTSFIEHNRGSYSSLEYAIEHVFNPLNQVINDWQTEESRQAALQYIQTHGNGVRELLTELEGTPEYNYATIHKCWLLIRAYLNELIHSKPRP